MRNYNIANIQIELSNHSKYNFTKKIPAFWSGHKTDSWYEKFCEDFAKKNNATVYDADLHLRTKSGNLPKHANFPFVEWF